MNKITETLLRIVSEFDGDFKGAFNIREDGMCAGRQSTEHVRIESKTDKPGLEIHIKPGTKGETISIPACVTRGNVDDLVYNDFYVGEGADVTIVAGCGVHTDNDDEARHNGIHRF
ncbi:ABC transporter permease, partial [Intestinibacillus massiliensis]|nr:ABC transporter permease [Intestinibacillus massiliensis]